ncbi:hypothetical protein [Streptomyces sp. NPDC006879]|uniref:hypothetical protein n=1 Tax=Streptomyces sp. NPDC006879 TaxID=3364767 RepID=UPI0036BD04D3
MRRESNGRPTPTDRAPRRKPHAWLGTMFRDLAHWLARRPVRVPEGFRALPHSADARMAIWAVTAADVVASVAVDAMVPPAYRPLHLVWVASTLLLTFGFCAMTARTPHLLDHQVLRLRTGPLRELTVPLAAIRTAKAAHGVVQGHGLRSDLTDAEVAACSVSSATTVLIELDQALPVPLRRGGRAIATRIRCTADQPAEAARLIREAAARTR